MDKGQKKCKRPKKLRKGGFKGEGKEINTPCEILK